MRTHRNGKVERGNNTDDAQRIRNFAHEMLVPLTRQHNAPNLPRQAQRNIRDVQKLDNLASTFGLDLAHLERDQHPEVIDVFGECGSNVTEDMTSLRGGHLAELQLRGFGGCDGGFNILGGGNVDSGEEVACGGVERFDGRAGRGFNPLAVVVSGEGLFSVEAESTEEGRDVDGGGLGGGRGACVVDHCDS
jgi:hypothetical protein